MAEKSIVPLESGSSRRIEGSENLLSSNAEVREERSEPQIPDEAFPCPECGQLLGPGARLCAACKQAVNPAKINLSLPVLEVSATHPKTQAEAAARVPFPWLLFLGFAVALVVASRYAGVHFQAGMLTAEAITSVWVFYDARQKGIQQPWRWALGSLLLWPFVFPWYLARRASPRASCPFVEGRGLAITILILFLAGLVFVAVRGPEKGADTTQQAPSTRPPSR